LIKTCVCVPLKEQQKREAKEEKRRKELEEREKRKVRFLAPVEEEGPRPSTSEQGDVTFQIGSLHIIYNYKVWSEKFGSSEECSELTEMEQGIAKYSVNLSLKHYRVYSVGRNDSADPEVVSWTSVWGTVLPTTICSQSMNQIGQLSGDYIRLWNRPRPWLGRHCITGKLKKCNWPPRYDLQQ